MKAVIIFEQSDGSTMEHKILGLESAIIDGNEFKLIGDNHTQIYPTEKVIKCTIE